MTLKTILLSSALAVFLIWCNEARTAQLDIANANNRAPSIAIGDTVAELGKNLMNIMQDKNSNYWFGSNGEGVYRYDGKNIVHFTTKDGLCNNYIRKIQEDKSGNIYFTTVEGISKFDGHTFTTLIASANSSSITEWKLEPDDLWFKGDQDSGVVYRYDGRTLYRLEFPKTELGEEFVARFPRSKFPNMTYSPYDVYCIYEDSNGNVWFGTCTLGVCRYDGKSFTWISEDELTEFDDGPSVGVRSIIEDKEGYFWFSNILHRYEVYANDSLGQGIDYKKENGIEKSKEYSENEFSYFMSSTKDNNGDLWMATFREGVWRYDGENLTHYPVKEGATNVTLFSIYKDNQGDLWLGTHEAGAYKFNGKSFERFSP